MWRGMILNHGVSDIVWEKWQTQTHKPSPSLPRIGDVSMYPSTIVGLISFCGRTFFRFAYYTLSRMMADLGVGLKIKYPHLIV